MNKLGSNAGKSRPLAYFKTSDASMPVREHVPTGTQHRVPDPQPTSGITSSTQRHEAFEICTPSREASDVRSQSTWSLAQASCGSGG